MNLECFKIKEIIYDLFDVIDCAAIAVASALGIDSGYSDREAYCVRVRLLVYS